MKNVRVIFVVALLVGAGFRSGAQNSGTGNPGMMGVYVPPAQELMMVHGFNSGPKTWAYLAALIRTEGDPITQYEPTLDGLASYDSNRDMLLRYMRDMGLSNNVAVVGHSMGALVSRLASRQHAMKGIISVGSPHMGAPLADAVLNGSIIVHNYEALLQGLAAESLLPDDPYAWASPWLSAQEMDQIRGDVDLSALDMSVLQSLDFGSLAGLATATHDLCTCSGGTAELEDGWGIAQEQTGYRESIAPIMDGTWYPAGPFILFPDGLTVGVQIGALLQEHGSNTFVDGVTLWNASMFDESSYWGMASAAFALMDFGSTEGTYWIWWHQDVVGGMPNDGVVPVWSMIMPNSQNIVTPRVRTIHTRETQDLASFILDRIKVDFLPH